MKIMLDCSPKEIGRLSEKFSHDFWQLRTPLTQYALSGKPYGLDNGCFSRFQEKKWRKLLQEAEENKPVFVCLPDVVGDARRTLDLFNVFKPLTAGLPRALVLQDGIGQFEIPWNDIDAVFVGGSDEFKISQEAINACRVAKMLGKWVHVGRVNSEGRVKNWLELGDSLDGSGISRFDYRLKSVLDVINGASMQEELFISDVD